MARVDSDLGAILLAVVNHLVTQGLFTAECCYLTISDGRDDIVPSAGEFVCTVCPRGGIFADPYLDGGGNKQAADFFEFSVSVYSTVQLDEADRETVFLTDSTLGLLQKLRLVLKALTALDVTIPGGNNVLRDPILPQGYQISRNGRGLGKFELRCRAAFDWDLTT